MLLSTEQAETNDAKMIQFPGTMGVITVTPQIAQSGRIYTIDRKDKDAICLYYKFMLALFLQAFVCERPHAFHLKSMIRQILHVILPLWLTLGHPPA